MMFVFYCENYLFPNKSINFLKPFESGRIRRNLLQKDFLQFFSLKCRNID